MSSTETAPATAAMSDRAGSQIRVEFTTSQPDISLPPDTGPVLVPTSLRRYGLSTLVNHLLSTPSPTPFDFLISGTFLRTSIDDYLTSHGLSSESTLTLEYVRSVIPPTYLSSFQHDDWVSCVDILSASSFPTHSKGDERILSGSYDGLVRIWDTSANVLATSSLLPGANAEASAAVKAAVFLSPSTIAAGGLDRAITIWEHDSSPTLQAKFQLSAHTLPVSSLAYHTPSQTLLSSSLDSSVALFSLTPSSLKSTLLSPSSSSTTSTTTQKKKARLSQPPIATHSPLATLTVPTASSTAPTTSAIFHPLDPSVAYSSSLDHSLRTWDLTTSALVDTRTLSHPLLCLTALPSLNILVAGTSARHISLVDPRAAVQTASVMTLRGHRNAVSCVTTEGAGYGVVSGGWDGAVRGWDVRFVKEGGVGGEGESVWVVEHGETQKKGGGKVFGVAWDQGVGVVSGGEDKRVAIHRSPEVGPPKKKTSGE